MEYYFPKENNLQFFGLKWAITVKALIQISNAAVSIEKPIQLEKIAKLTKLNNIFPILNR